MGQRKSSNITLARTAIYNLMWTLSAYSPTGNVQGRIGFILCPWNKLHFIPGKGSTDVCLILLFKLMFFGLL